MDSNLYELFKRYQKAEVYMDNQHVPLSEKEKHIDRFIDLKRELEEATRNMSYEELEEAYNEVKGATK